MAPICPYLKMSLNTTFWTLTFPIHPFQLYLHARVASAPRFRLFIGLFVVLYALLLGAALYVAASRIFDHKHHGVDVLFGALMGTGIAGTMVGSGRGLQNSIFIYLFIHFYLVILSDFLGKKTNFQVLYGPDCWFLLFLFLPFEPYLFGSGSKVLSNFQFLV